MRSGDLRHRVTFQQRTEVRDALGGASVAWRDVATVWANIQPLGARERLAAQAIHVEVSHTVTIRYHAQFANPRTTAALRLLYGERIFDIHGVTDPDERHQSLELACGEGMNDG